MKHALILFSFAALLVLAVPQSSADEPRYSAWGENDAQGLIERLKTLIDEAERARAADPLFLRDLRSALDEYDRPALQELLHDDFSDGEFSRAPTWSLAAGRFDVDRNLGLRSIVRANSARSDDRAAQDNLAAALLSTLLDDKRQSGGDGSSRAEIFVTQPIGNAFTLRYDLISQVRAGRFNVDVFQGQGRGMGYRLAYYPGQSPSLELLRFSARGEQVIEVLTEALNLEDGFRHRVEFARSAGRLMTVRVDGRALISVTDSAFRDDFDGLTLTNEGGDYAVREITIYGQR